MRAARAGFAWPAWRSAAAARPAIAWPMAWCVAVVLAISGAGWALFAWAVS